METHSSRVACNYEVYATLIEPPAGLGDEQRRNIFSRVSLPHLDPVLKDPRALLVEEDCPIRSLRLRLQPYLQTDDIHVFEIDRYELASSNSGLRQEQDDRLVPRDHDRVDECLELLDGDKLPRLGFRIVALVPSQIPFPDGQGGIRSDDLLIDQVVQERRMLT